MSYFKWYNTLKEAEETKVVYEFLHYSLPNALYIVFTLLKNCQNLQFQNQVAKKFPRNLCETPLCIDVH